MSQKYIILLCLIFPLIIEINCQTTQFKPAQRELHTATLINNNLYILSGVYLVNGVRSKEFFYLDVSVPFNTQKLLWQDLSKINTVPPHASAASVKGGADNNTLFLYGGVTSDTTAALVYTFNPQNNMWNILTIASTAPTVRKRNLMAVIDSNKKMYLWGGTDPTNKNNFNDMTILDTVNPNWSTGSIVGAPSPRVNYGAVLLPDNNIIYMGGYNLGNNIELTLDQVYIYNTINDSWETKSTTGAPSPRDGFSAVLGIDGQRIIIYGGTATPNSDPLLPGDSLYVLNLKNFEWSAPKTSGQTPNSRMFHTANVIGKYMVISFGQGYVQSIEGDISLLDISNNDEYKWTNNFELPPPPSSSSSSSSPSSPQQPPTTMSVPSSLSSNNNSAIIGTAIGSSLGGFLLSAICFLLYKRYKLKQREKNSIPTPGSEGNYENLVPTRRNTYNQGRGQEILQIPEVPIYNVYNNGREAIPIANNEKLSLHNIDESLLQHLVQTVRQEVTSGQASNPNIARNRNYY